MLRKNHVYDLDGANNRVEVSGSKGVLLKGEYAMVGDDAKMNRYSTLPGGPGSGQVEERYLSYDLSGNLIGSEVDCLGDANGDHVVDSADLAIISAAYDSSYPDEDYDPRADFDGDGDVDEDDVMVWVNNANAACAYFAFAYDYRNRLVDIEVRHETQQALDPPPPPMHRYGYDAFGRRVKKTTDVGTGEERTLYFIYGGDSAGGGWQLLEEREEVPLEDPALNAMFVHSGLYVDDVVQMRRWNELEDAFEDFYFHCDDLSSVRALTDEDGELVELYDYHEYGLPTITDPNTIVNGRPALLASSAFGNPFLFTGRMYDAETRLYHYRTRQYEPRMGRFISVDSIGVWGDEANLGNGYAYVGNRPGDWVDPWGLTRWDLPSYDPGLNRDKRITPEGVSGVIEAAGNGAQKIGQIVIDNTAVDSVGAGVTAALPTPISPTGTRGVWMDETCGGTEFDAGVSGGLPVLQIQNAIGRRTNCTTGKRVLTGRCTVTTPVAGVSVSGTNDGSSGPSLVVHGQTPFVGVYVYIGFDLNSLLGTNRRRVSTTKSANKEGGGC